MTVEEAAKIILSAGIVMPDVQGKLKALSAVPADHGPQRTPVKN
jgi:uncharacterized membrane protein